ncbi:MAG: DUF883 family protein [Betaproteobacteria bacterium]|nr:MAG: DUF883 family protein [Betaproteobacteria bacterium]TMH41883.1 MAG: DUF883 family protein [Betaproteobacteria bacterium]
MHACTMGARRLRRVSLPARPVTRVTGRHIFRQPAAASMGRPTPRELAMQTPDATEEAKRIDAYKEQLAELGDTADKLVHAHPWKALGAVAVVGLILGLLLGRRS